MSQDVSQKLPDEVDLALAYTPQGMKDALRIFFEFDARLARIVSSTNEPMLGQMRLAWWRDTLALDVNDRPTGDAVLDALGQHWQGQEAALIELTNGWEQMLVEPPLPTGAALAFAKGRGAGLAGWAALSVAQEEQCQMVREAGKVWALADAASHIADESERETLLSLAKSINVPIRLDKGLRGIAVLYALASRSIKNDGAPLMAGRGAGLVALKAGLFGR